MYPEELRYTAEHEWVRDPGAVEGAVRVGITDYAQKALGDIVYVILPEVAVTVESSSPVAELESINSVSDVYAPVTGRVVATNPHLEATPELVNSDPYADGWLFEVVPDDPEALDGLLDASAYEASLES